MSDVAKGKVVITPKGDYNSSATYVFLDIVLYNGSSWVWINENSGSGITPSDSATTYWYKLAQGMADYVEVSEYPTASNVTMNKIYHKLGTAELKVTVLVGTDYEWQAFGGGADDEVTEALLNFMNRMTEGVVEAPLYAGDTVISTSAGDVLVTAQNIGGM